LREGIWAGIGVVGDGMAPSDEVGPALEEVHAAKVTKAKAAIRASKRIARFITYITKDAR